MTFKGSYIVLAFLFFYSSQIYTQIKYDFYWETIDFDVLIDNPIYSDVTKIKGEAIRGNKIAQEQYGDLILSGVVSSEKRYSNARRWYFDALIRSDYTLDLKIAHTHWREKNIDSTILWLNNAVSKESAVANYNLGLLYTNGKYLTTNRTLAKEYFDAAHQLGERRATRFLGLQEYENGYNIKKAAALLLESDNPIDTSIIQEIRKIYLDSLYEEAKNMNCVDRVSFADNVENEIWLGENRKKYLKEIKKLTSSCDFLDVLNEKPVWYYLDNFNTLWNLDSMQLRDVTSEYLARVIQNSHGDIESTFNLYTELVQNSTAFQYEFIGVYLDTFYMQLVDAIGYTHVNPKVESLWKMKEIYRRMLDYDEDTAEILKEDFIINHIYFGIQTIDDLENFISVIYSEDWLDQIERVRYIAIAERETWIKSYRSGDIYFEYLLKRAQSVYNYDWLKIHPQLSVNYLAYIDKATFYVPYNIAHKLEWRYAADLAEVPLSKMFKKRISMNLGDEFAIEQNFRNDLSSFNDYQAKDDLYDMLDSFAMQNCICEFRDSNYIFMFDAADVKFNDNNLNNGIVTLRSFYSKEVDQTEYLLNENRIAVIPRAIFNRASISDNIIVEDEPFESYPSWVKTATINIAIKKSFISHNKREQRTYSSENMYRAIVQQLKDLSNVCYTMRLLYQNSPASQ